MTGLPVKLSQSEASSLFSWQSMASTQLWCGLFKKGGGGGGGERNENKNKFEKLKANRSQSKERKFVPKCRRKNLLGVFAWTTNMPVLVEILKQFLCFLFLLGEGLGARGEGGGVSDPKCNQ